MMSGFLIATSDVASQAANLLATAPPEQGKSSMDFSMLFMILSLLVCVALPVFFILIGKMKFEGKISQVFVGLLACSLFMFFLPQLISAFFNPAYKAQEATLPDKNLQNIATVFIAEMGRFFAFYLVRKRKKEFGNAIMLGVGFSVLESFFIAFSTIQYFLDNKSGESWVILSQVLIAVVFCARQISSSIMMFVAVQKKRYGIAIMPIILGLMIMIPYGMFQFSL